MIAFLDNDVVSKLCIYRLLDDVIAALGLARSNAFVLHTLKYRLKRGKYSKEDTPQIAAMVGDLGEIKDAAADSDVEELMSVQGINEGEALLFAHAAGNPDSYVLTGDKTSIEALVGVPRFADMLKGRIICFEQTIRYAIGHVGFAAVRDRVVPRRDADGAMRSAFGSGMQATEANVVAALDLLINHLQNACGGLLRDP